MPACSIQHEKSLICQNTMQLLSKQLKRAGVALFRNGNLGYYFVHPSSKGERWQITVYDTSGVVGDTQHTSMKTMVGILSGLTLVPAEHVDRILGPLAKREVGKSEHRSYRSRWFKRL